MSNHKFITVNQNPISLTQAMNYLQSRGKLGDFVNEIIHQYVLEQEVTKIEISERIITKAIANFRQTNKLDGEKFALWLEQQKQTEASFTKQITCSIQLQQLIFQVTKSKISQYFIEHKLLLDSFILSRLIVEDRELAEELKTQIIEEGTSFEELAKEYSIARESNFNGMMGLVSRGQLSNSVRAALDKAKEGNIIGAIPIDDCWCLLRVEKIIPASLKNKKLVEKMRQEIFEDYLKEKIAKTKIEMNLFN